MTFLPIVARELRLRSRQPYTYWGRCAAALAGSAVAAVLLLAALVFGPGRVGKVMFATLSWMAWLFCLVEGVRNTADCVSEEKREGTLGLLFLTDLKGYDVVLGKFIAASLGAFYFFLAVLPVLGLALVMGGVTGAEFGRMALALVNTLIFSLALGLLISVFSRDERRAWLASILALVFFTVEPPVISALGLRLQAAQVLPCPWTLFISAFEDGNSPNGSAFWTQACLVPLASLTCLGLASLVLPRAWQEKGREGTQRLGRPGFATGPGSRRSGPASRLLQTHPIAWLASREASPGRLPWLLAVPAAAVAILVGGSFAGQMPVLTVLWGGAIGLHLVFTVCVAWEASHSFSSLRRSGMLELLMVAPLRPTEILQGQELALRRRFLGPVALLAGTEWVLLLAHAVVGLTRSSPSDALLPVLFALVLVVSSLALWVTDMLAAEKVGLWMGLANPRPGRAWARTVLYVLILPYLLAIAPGLFCFGLAIPAVLLAKNLVLISWAGGQLRDELRPALPGRLR